MVNGQWRAAAVGIGALFVFLTGCGRETAVLSPMLTPTAVPTSAIAETAVVEIEAGSAAKREEEMRFLALGDSYTIGQGVPEDERWPMQLATQLRAQGVPIEDPVIIARTGWTTAELAAGIDEANPQGMFDLVTLLIGVNNQYRGLSQEQYREEFVTLLLRAIGFAGGDPQRVMVLSIPDWGVTPFAHGQDRAKIAAEIDAFNGINYAESVHFGVHYVDVTPASRQAFNDASLTATDFLHPSGKMYTQWVGLILPLACKILESGV